MQQMIANNDNDCFANWLATIPNYGKMPLYATKLKMLVSIGSYVLLQLNVVDDPTVVRIVDYVGDVITCNVFESLQSTHATMRCTSALAYGMKETVQTRKKHSTTINEIIDLAFVFTLSDVEAGKVTHAGIRNCFLLRYRSNNDVLENVGYTYTFPCESPMHIHFRSSSSNTVWNGIVGLQDIMWKIMNTVSQKQITNSPKIPAHIDTTLWDYLLYRCSNVVKNRSLQGVRGKVRGTSFYGLKRSSIRMGKNPTLLRFQSREQLRLLRQIFGDFSTFGCRRKRPKLGRTEIVQHNNKLNIVLGLDEEERPFRNKTYRCCVDIAKDESGSYIQVVYDSYLYTASGIINYCDDDVTNDSYVVDMMKSLRECDDIPSSSNELVLIGGMVRRENGNQLLKVTKVTSNDITLEYILPYDRSGEVVVEKDFRKINEEINDFLQ
jgi:hypothetical protein